MRRLIEHVAGALAVREVLHHHRAALASYRYEFVAAQRHLYWSLGYTVVAGALAAMLPETDDTIERRTGFKDA